MKFEGLEFTKSMLFWAYESVTSILKLWGFQNLHISLKISWNFHKCIVGMPEINETSEVV